jgi:hypothetical protein
MPTNLILKRITTSLLFLTLLILGESSTLIAQNTPVNIPGTHLYIAAPAGYKVSKSFKGLEKNKDIYIKVYDPYNTNYIKYAQTFTRESLENGGSEVQDYKKLSISGFPAKYASLQTNVGGTSYFLVFGDSSFSTMVIAVCPANKDSDNQQLKAALLSITYSKDLKIDPLAGTFFNVDDTSSSYRFTKFKNDYYIYSSNGVVADPYLNESILSIFPFTSEYSVGDETIERAILSSYQQYGITDAKTKKETQVQIGTQNAMEAEVNAKIDNKKAVLYRLTMVNGKKAILILGIATSDFDKNMDAFRTLAHTLKFK